MLLTYANCISVEIERRILYLAYIDAYFCGKSNLFKLSLLLREILDMNGKKEEKICKNIKFVKSINYI